MTSPVGTSASTVMLRQRRPFWCTATTAVAVDRPSATTSRTSSMGGPTATARENTGVRRAHRLVSEPLGHRDDRLREHLGALDHLAFVAPGPISPAVSAVNRSCRRAHLEQIQQALHRPLGRFLGNLAQLGFHLSCRPASRSA
ncbi:hypothetical protein I549_0844 [Mycobacterium avium subsp. avium 2285 (R)]|nr:hypothetical protein I549_0844 [Mycobacterium avium subsp. avium 2285 (R)]